jgi:hypothetical protein
MPQSIPNTLSSLATLNCVLTGLSKARAWTAVRWRQESTGLRACLPDVEASLAALPAQCRPWRGSDDQALQLGKACSEITETLQNIKMSLNYLTGELSGGERTRELNIFTRDRKELQREIRGLQEMLATLYVSSDLHEEGASQAPTTSERSTLIAELPQDYPSSRKAETSFTRTDPGNGTQPHGSAERSNVKLEFVSRIGDNWRDLADLLDVPLRDKQHFPQGDEPRALWEWLEQRRSLAALPVRLREIGRDDLACLWPPTP